MDIAKTQHSLDEHRRQIRLLAQSIRLLNPAFRILTEPQPREFMVFEKEVNKQLATPKSSDEDAASEKSMSADQLEANLLLFGKQFNGSQRHHNDEGLRLQIDSFTVCYNEIAELTSRAAQVSEALQVRLHQENSLLCNFGWNVHEAI